MLAMYDEKEILREYIESEKYEAAQEAAKEVRYKNSNTVFKRGIISGADCSMHSSPIY